MSFPMSCFRDLRVDASLFVMLAIHVATMTISVQLQYKEPVFTALIGIVYGPILAMTILIHEFAQAAAKRWCSKLPKDSLYTLVHQELIQTVAGPLSHIPQALFWLLLYMRLVDGDFSKFLSIEVDMDSLKEGSVAFMSTMAMQAFVMNAVMLKLNLVIPVHPFPGARVLVATLVLLGASLLTAGLLTAIAGIVVGILGLWVSIFLILVDYHVIACCLGGLACYTVFSGVRLLRLTVGDNLRQHVLFQQECYNTDSCGRQRIRRKRRKKDSCDDNDGESIDVIV